MTFQSQGTNREAHEEHKENGGKGEGKQEMVIGEDFLNGEERISRKAAKGTVDGGRGMEDDFLKAEERISRKAATLNP
jgi:hypothetical protein